MENKLRSQFSMNALLFKKSWSECKNPSFLHKAMCIVLDHGSTKMQRCLPTFVAFYSRRLWTSQILNSDLCVETKGKRKVVEDYNPVKRYHIIQ